MSALSPLTLAYLGDAVLCLAARSALLAAGIHSPAACTKAELMFVTAESQAAAAKRLLPVLTQEEADLFRRAKNAKGRSAPHHTDLYTYRLSTAVEAVFGFLYLEGRQARIAELFEMGFQKTIAFPEEM